jgi:hypothetical protein
MVAMATKARQDADTEAQHPTVRFIVRVERHFFPIGCKHIPLKLQFLRSVDGKYDDQGDGPGLLKTAILAVLSLLLVVAMGGLIAVARGRYMHWQGNGVAVRQ